MPPPKSPNRPEPENPLEEVPGHKAGDFVERDLWVLDDEWDTGKPPPPPAKPPLKSLPPAPRGMPAPTPGPPTPRAPRTTPTAPPEPRPEPAPRPDSGPRSVPERLEPLEQEVVEVLDGWSLREPPAPQPVPPAPAVEPAAVPAAEEPVSSSGQPAAAESAPAERPAPTAEVPADAEPRRPRRPRLRPVEWASLLVVAGLIIAFGALFLVMFFQLPHRRSRAEMPTLPCTGERLVVEAVATFWREPVRSGPNPDAARQNVRLIPVLEVTLQPGGGDGALRVFFRNSTGSLVGDSVTRTFHAGMFAASGNNRLEIAATSGFDDEGMYAGYQTAQSDTWTVEVFEGPEERAPFDSYRLLFKLPIATVRR